MRNVFHGGVPIQLLERRFPVDRRHKTVLIVFLSAICGPHWALTAGDGMAFHESGLSKMEQTGEGEGLAREPGDTQQATLPSLPGGWATPPPPWP